MSDADTQRKTVITKASPNTTTTPVVESGGGSNVLNKYRSFTYNFTLAALKKNEANDPASYRNKPLDLVILKSGGKGYEGIALTDSILNSAISPQFTAIDSRRTDVSDAQKNINFGKKFIDGFNNESPGRFDMYIENVEIESLMTFTPGANTTLPTSIKFDVIEPYSINGFIEALHVSAVAAGYPSYSLASFVLKMEFQGYPDTDQFPSPEIIPNSSRYFIFGFTGMEVDITEKGMKYRCSGVPYNEKGFGQPNVLKKPTNMAGNSVQEILENLIKNVNSQVVSSDNTSKEVSTNHDQYEIKFPSWDDKTGWDYTKPNAIAGHKVSEILRDKIIYKFPDPATTQTPNATKPDNQRTPSAQQTAKDPDTDKYTPRTPAVQFNDGANIHECISSLIRDSEYARNILKKIPSPIDEYGMIDYFLIKMEIINLPETDQTTRRPYQKYRYIVVPYKVHYTTIPGFSSQQVSESKLKLITRREYNYIYTGKNIDVQNFKLNFNTLFFEAMPNALGNNDAPGARDALGNGNTSKVTATKQNMGNVQTEQNSNSGERVDQAANSVTQLGGRAGQIQDDPYSVLAINMHDAIVNSKASMITGEIDILGDPFFLVTGGIGNYNPKPLGRGLTVDGEAANDYGDVLISINFRNPIDISTFEKGGMMYFDTKRVPFSGVYRVSKAISSFKEGKFNQRLEIIRIPGQILDTNLPVSDPKDKYKTTPDPLDRVVPTTTMAFNPSSRPSTGNLLLQLGRGLPSPGLPGILSNFTAAVGGLGGNVTSLLSQVSGAVTNGIGKITAGSSLFGGSIPGGIDQLASGIRLQASGLTSSLQTSLSASALIGQVSNTIQSAFPVTKVAETLAADIVSKSTAVTNLLGVQGSGIGVGSTISLDSANSAVKNIVNIGTTAVTDLQSQVATLPRSVAAFSGLVSNLNENATSAISRLGSTAAGLANDISNKVTNLTAGVPTDPTALASKFGINISQLSGLGEGLKSKITEQLAGLAKTVPPNVDLVDATAKGLVLDYIPAGALSNIPATAPYSTAPAPAIDTAFFTNIVKAGGAQALANAFGVSDVSKISANLLSNDSVKGILNSAQSALSNPLAELTKQVNQPDITALGGKLLAAKDQLTSITGTAESLETSFNSVKSTVGSAINTGGVLLTSVTDKFGSLSKGTSPLNKLMLGSGGGTDVI